LIDLVVAHLGVVKLTGVNLKLLNLDDIDVEVIDLEYNYLKICMLLIVKTIVFNHSIIEP